MIVEHNDLPVIISSEYKRMDQKQTVFMRGFWDSEIIPLCEKFEIIHYNLKPSSSSEGYTQLERALNAAAWAVCFEHSPNSEYGCANTGFYCWDAEINLQKATFANLKDASIIVKNAAKFFGANLVGIAEFDPRWVYSSWYSSLTKESVPAEFPFEVKNVIVLAVSMDFSACLTSPSLISCAATGLGYSRMAETAKKLATFIRMLGYNVIPCSNDTALSIPLAIQAGLGEVGRNGMLITPQYGPRVRLFKIFTDMPLQADKPITFGVSQFCIKCKKCAQACPSGAIPFEAKPTMYGTSASNNSGVLKWYMEPERCFRYWALNSECINCIACCPYNKWSSWHHGLTQTFTESIVENPLFGSGGKSLVEPLGELETKIVESALDKAAWVISDQEAEGRNLTIAGQGFYKWNGKLNKDKVEFNSLREASSIIKKAAKFFGADLVGIAGYNKELIDWNLDMFSKQKTEDYLFNPKSVIVLAVEIYYDACKTGTSMIATSVTGLGYSRMAETAKKVADFLRELGHKAIPCGDDTAPSIPLAVMAGLGERGGNGLLVTREYGSRVLLCKIFTDLELKSDKPINFGVQDYCTGCKICIEACPVEAILLDGAEADKWQINAEKCSLSWADNPMDCVKCITSCPFNNSISWDNGFNDFLADTPLATLLCRHDSMPGTKNFVNKDVLKTWWK